MSDTLNIKSRDYWFKVVEMLQQNWALIDPVEGGAIVYFLSDASGVFDQIAFGTTEAAEASLSENGFRRFGGDQQAQSFLQPPSPPFSRQPHPNGPIYSSGRFWKGLPTQ